MGSLKENNEEAKQSRRLETVGRLMDGGLQSRFAASGIRLTGFSISLKEYETLLVLKAVVDGAAVVAFVGAGTPGLCLLKAKAGAASDKLAWKPDRWAGG